MGKMNAWGIFQLLLNLSLIAVGVAIFVRSKRPRKDDPRLSKGLQLLQSKIAILEDLSDRVDNQVKQLANILDQKAKMTHEHVEMIQEHLNQVEKSIQKSLEVSQIFQDKIPHKEIIERQNTIKYIQAARLAHQGVSVDEIAKTVDIPRSELDFIAKVNKDRLMFSEKDLPSWALNGSEIKKMESTVDVNTRDMTGVYEGIVLDRAIQDQDKKIENEFKESLQTYSSENSFESYQPSDFSTEQGSSSITNEGSASAVGLDEGVSFEAIENAEKSSVNSNYSSTESELLDRTQMDSPIIQKLGSIVENKLGFNLNISNEGSGREKGKQKIVKPFVFTRID